MTEPVPASGSGNRGALHLWCAHADDLLSEDTAHDCAEVLSEEERGRWQRFRVEHSRREYLAAHALVRNALSHYRPVAPRDWRFAIHAHGKPAPEPECGLRFNLSHSTGLVVCLVADAPVDIGPVEVGIDVEARSRAPQIAEVARRVFSAAEREQLQALILEERLDRCLSLWTLKEAYIKARGLGMALPLERISFLFDRSGAARLQLGPAVDDDARQWRFCTLEHAQHRIAIAVESAAAGALSVWEARPPMATPVPIETGAVNWFPVAPRAGAPCFTAR